LSRFFNLYSDLTIVTNILYGGINVINSVGAVVGRYSHIQENLHLRQWRDTDVVHTCNSDHPEL